MSVRLWLAVAALVFVAPAAASSDAFECTESGLLAAIATGGGPHTFDCPGPTVLQTAAEITIRSAVSLDGGGLLTLDGGDHHRILSISAGATVELRRLTLTRGNSAVGTRWGGAIRNDGSLTLDDVTVSHSRATLRGAALANTGTLLVRNSRLAQNGFVPPPSASPVQGGAIYSHAGQVVIDSTVIEGNLAGAGAGIMSLGVLEVLRSRIVGNDNGGVEVNGATTLTDTEIAGNHTGFTCGGLAMGRDADVTALRTTFHDNRSENTCGGIGAAGRLVLVNSTVSRNVSRLHRSGGIDVGNPSTTVLIVNSTIVDNEGPEAGGLYIFQGHVVLRGSIVAGNRAAGGVDCRRATVDAFLDSAGGNVFDESGCPAGPDDVVVPAATVFRDLLGPLGANGGATPTHHPLRDSAAVDLLGDELCEAAADFPLDSDQRGLPRPWDGDADGVARCDAGSVERVVHPAVIGIHPPVFPPGVRSWMHRDVFVVLFGSPDLEVEEVPLGSIAFGPGAAAPLADAPGRQLFDVNRDGELDLVLRFPLRNTGIGSDDEEACLVASLENGSSIEVCGPVRIVGP